LTVGKDTVLPASAITWPHKVSIGSRCIIEPGVFFKFDGIWSEGKAIIIHDKVFIGRGCEFNIRKGIEIGSRCAIASGCKFIDHDHGVVGDELDEVPGKEGRITLESSVWLGFNVTVLKGVTIGRSAVVGAGAVVTRSIPPREVWAGVPAVKIGERRVSQ
jgi:acetyltransferase-like isoleucine patch superfamily enzyme